MLSTKRISLLLSWGLLATGCGSGAGPMEIADAFWTASKEGDIELAKTYVWESESASIKEPDESQQISDFTLGDVAVDGDLAKVGTTLASKSIDVSFETVLVRKGDQWKVDLDQTTGEMMKSLFGSSMGDLVEEMGKAVGEAMGESMKAMAEGMAEGFKAVADSMSTNH